MTAASDSWRVRIVRLDEYEYFDFEWHDDILYSTPQAEPIEIGVRWRVDIVAVVDGRVRRSFEGSSSRDESAVIASKISHDLETLTVPEFGERYMVVP